mgnify:CR=1 FL=1
MEVSKDLEDLVQDQEVLLYQVLNLLKCQVACLLH